MSDDTAAGYNKVQFSTFCGGDQFVIRCESGEELAEIAQGLADHMEAALKGINSFKQTVVANGVFTGDSSRRSSGGRTSSDSGRRAADTPPPSGNGSIPHCKHGPMEDLRGKGYKSDFYCTLKTDNWREKCKPVKL